MLHDRFFRGSSNAPQVEQVSSRAGHGAREQPDSCFARPHPVSPPTMPLPRIPVAEHDLPRDPSLDRRPRRSLKGAGIAVCALLVTAGIAFADRIPSWDGAGAAWTSFLPWTAVLLAVLGVFALVRRAWWGLSAVIVAAMVWSGVFVPQLMAAPVVSGPADLLVATQNIGAGNADPTASAQALIATGAGLVAVQEIVGSTGGATALLDGTYGYHAAASTVGLWSLWQLGQPQPLELGLGWARALRIVVHHPSGDVAVYAVHLPSVRPGDTAARDQAVGELAAVIRSDTAPRVLVLGDLNTATTDPALKALTDQMADSRETVKAGFGFTWPAQFPMTRPDHVLGRGVTAVSDQVLDAGGSDHRALVVGLRFAG